VIPAQLNKARATYEGGSQLMLHNGAGQRNRLVHIKDLPSH